ncbi:hypothetical protein [Streptomyces sp. OP7]|uniref:hypothetical protein n=1 Tax=Streptomyces sp. OP7 TaxID=3142462 RepID=UPI0032E8CADD
MSHESIHEHLLISARKWAHTAVDAYLEEPIDQDFAVHHMAVAVEHASKAYLASIAPVLLASEKQPSVDDLLVLSGNEDKTKKGRAGLKTIGGEGAILLTYGVLPEGRLRRGHGGGSGGVFNGVSAVGDKHQPGDGSRPSGSA